MTAISPKRYPLQLSVTVNRSVSLLPNKIQQIIQEPSKIRPPTNKSTLIKTIVAAAKQKLQAIRKILFKRKKQQTNPLHYSSNSPSNPNYNLRQRPSTIIPPTKALYHTNHSYSSISSNFNDSNSSSSFTSNDCSRQSPIQTSQREILFYPISQSNEHNSTICYQSSKNKIYPYITIIHINKLQPSMVSIDY